MKTLIKMVIVAAVMASAAYAVQLRNEAKVAQKDSFKGIVLAGEGNGGI